MDTNPDLSKMKPWDRMMWKLLHVNRNPVTKARQLKRTTKAKRKLDRQNRRNGRLHNQG